LNHATKLHKSAAIARLKKNPMKMANAIKNRETIKSSSSSFMFAPVQLSLLYASNKTYGHIPVDGLYGAQSKPGQPMARVALTTG
jgi:hypothetical protein